MLAGSAGAKVEVTLAWGPNPGDRQTIGIPALTTSYAKFPLKFTAKADTNEGRFEIVGTGNGAFHIGAASLMPGGPCLGFQGRDDPFAEGAGNFDCALARRELRVRLRLA